MILFWAIAGALAVLAIVIVLVPRGRRGVSAARSNISIYRDELRELDADLAAGTLAKADYERARRELEARLLEDVDRAPAPPKRSEARRLAPLLAITVPLFALAVYFLVGNPRALDPETHGVTARQVEAMVERLATRLKDNPEDAEGWKLLGRSYSVLGRYADAAAAYAKASARAPRDSELLADFADALAMARGGRLEGEPEELVRRALEIDPQNLKALALAGTAAYNRKDFADAAALWQRMLPLVPPNSEDARAIQANIDEAKQLANARPLRGVVRVSPELKGKVSPEDTVFIFARAAEGPAMPLAVLRKQARELPLSFALDDSMAMAPGMKLSTFPRVVVAARISKSGNAAPQAGDLQGSSGPVASDSSAVTVLIDTVVR